MSRVRSVATSVGDVVLWIAAVLGAICAVLVVCSFAFGISVIMFKTGSMSPAIPAGSAAIVREIPASEVHVGDVVTVDRPGELPITHRVVQISGADAGATRELVLRGDANEAVDPAPYAVDRVRLVLFAVPGLAYVLAWLAQPVVLLVGVAFVALLVGWAFWPKAERRRGGRDGGADDDGGHGGGAGGAGSGEGTGDGIGTGGAVVVGSGGSQAAAKRPAPTGSAFAVLLLGLAMTAFGGASPAGAAPREVQLGDGVIRLTVISDPERMAGMAPGSTARWIVGVRALTDEPGSVHVALDADTATSDGFAFDVRVCSTRFDELSCSGTGAVVLPETRPAPVGRLLERRMAARDQLWVAVSVTLATDAPPGATADVRLSAEGFGEEVSTGGSGGGSTPPTGSPLGLAGSGWEGLPLVGSAVIAVALGLVLWSGGARRRRAAR
ncbi:signal peptidase I [Agromyces sp. NPDC058110]|uniref:signal peptidase I n=1 Tax=Agromyces sp. NPDC058110 TaxID=3346345 RepID=UPI0036DDE72A